MDTFPQARKDGLVIQELPDELLVYDERRNKAHCLNRTAALIWKQCNGHRDVAAISTQVSRSLGATVSEEAVWFALSQFKRDHLLEENLTLPPSLSGMNRRQMVRTLGLAAVVAVPLVTSIVAPTPAQAATCLPTGATCTSSAQCCSGLCNTGTCA